MCQARHVMFFLDDPPEEVYRLAVASIPAVHLRLVFGGEAADLPLADASRATDAAKRLYDHTHDESSAYRAIEVWNGSDLALFVDRDEWDAGFEAAAIGETAAHSVRAASKSRLIEVDVFDALDLARDTLDDIAAADDVAEARDVVEECLRGADVGEATAAARLCIAAAILDESGRVTGGLVQARMRPWAQALAADAPTTQLARLILSAGRERAWRELELAVGRRVRAIAQQATSIG